MINILNIVLLTFFNPSVKLQSGKSIKLIGNGPPLLFSSGLFGTMPNSLYSDFLSKLKNHYTLINIDGFSPIVKDDIDDIVTSLSVDNIAYLSHSSFNYDVLENNKINKAILLDPITLPRVDLNGLNRQIINVEYPILIIKADKLYNSEFSLPEWQDPIIKGNITSINYENVGHPDILDNTWANFAKNYGFWDSTNGEILEFKNWKYKNNNVNKIRKEYRNYVSQKIIYFINN